MNQLWFKRKGIIFIPVSIIAWIFLMLTLVLVVYEFIKIDSASHSASDTLMNFIFMLFVIYALYSLIAFLANHGIKSLKKDNNS